MGKSGGSSISDNQSFDIFSDIHVSKPYSANKPKNRLRIILLIVLGLLVVAIVYQSQLSEREKKRDKEIERIKVRPAKSKYDNESSCEVYSLRARASGWFPCYSCKGTDSIFLFTGETWKIGKTCLGADKRYSDLAERGLYFFPEFAGTEKDCLIKEKEMIYAYPTMPECLKREYLIPRPPGNRIDR